MIGAAYRGRIVSAPPVSPSTHRPERRRRRAESSSRFSRPCSTRRPTSSWRRASCSDFSGPRTAPRVRSPMSARSRAPESGRTPSIEPAGRRPIVRVLQRSEPARPPPRRLLPKRSRSLRAGAGLDQAAVRRPHARGGSRGAAAVGRAVHRRLLHRAGLLEGAGDRRRPRTSRHRAHADRRRLRDHGQPRRSAARCLAVRALRPGRAGRSGRHRGRLAGRLAHRASCALQLPSAGRGAVLSVAVDPVRQRPRAAAAPR